MARRRLQDARILLTGASSGIGRALALLLAEKRAKLTLTARRGDLLESVANDCAVRGGRVEILAGDITEAAFRSALVDLTVDRWSGLDVLINNAGVSAHGRFGDSDPATMRRVMEVNFFSAVELTRSALPLLGVGKDDRDEVPPAIVNVGSILGRRGVPFNGEYCASKFALRGWNESLRTELAAEGVDVILISPGSTETEFFEHLLAQRAELPWRESGRLPAGEVARQVVAALEHGRREIFPNWRGRALVLANRIAPGLVDWRLRRYGARLP